MAELDPKGKLFRYVATATVGLSRARNIGLRHSQGEIVAFINDDCVVDKGWLEALAVEFAGEDAPAAVFGRILPLMLVPSARPVAIKDVPKRQVYLGKANPWRVGHGANMAIRREALEALAGFDESLGPGGDLMNCDDADMIYRLLVAGHRVVYSLLPLVHHKQWRTRAKVRRLEAAYALGSGALYVKHLRCGDLYPLAMAVDKLWMMLTEGLSRHSAPKPASKHYLYPWRTLLPDILYKAYAEVRFTLEGLLRGARYPLNHNLRLYQTERR